MLNTALYLFRFRFYKNRMRAWYAHPYAASLRLPGDKYSSRSMGPSSGEAKRKSADKSSGLCKPMFASTICCRYKVSDHLMCLWVQYTHWVLMGTVHTLSAYGYSTHTKWLWVQYTHQVVMVQYTQQRIFSNCLIERSRLQAGASPEDQSYTRMLCSYLSCNGYHHRLR